MMNTDKRSESRSLCSVKHSDQDFHSNEVKVSLHPEVFRIVSYIMFWFMVGIAALITKLAVTPYPYDDPNNPLKIKFGYANICVNWDYDPSLWIAAILYIPVELPLLIYIFLCWVRVFRDYRASVINGRYFIALTALNVVEFLLSTLFRMIFVVHASDNVVGHTLGFMGLQIALAINSIRSLIYYSEYHHLKPKDWKLWVGIGYIIVLIGVTLFKLIYASSIFMGHPILTVGDPSVNSLGQFMDTTWLILAGVIPLFLAVYLYKETSAVEFTIHWTELDLKNLQTYDKMPVGAQENCEL